MSRLQIAHGVQSGRLLHLIDGDTMASERIQRQIANLLDQAEAAVTQLDWAILRDRVQAVLTMKPGSQTRWITRP